MKFRTDKTRGGYEIRYMEQEKGKWVGVVKDINQGKLILCSWDSQGKARGYNYRGYHFIYDLIPKETEHVTLYECLNNIGEIVFLDIRGRRPLFNEKRFSDSYFKYDDLKNKTGRTLRLNLDTWEIEPGDA